jgi:putative endonuclease
MGKLFLPGGSIRKERSRARGRGRSTDSRKRANPCLSLAIRVHIPATSKEARDQLQEAFEQGDAAHADLLREAVPLRPTAGRRERPLPLQCHRTSKTLLRNRGRLESGVPFVYLLRCSDDSLYTGVTKNLERRLAQHLAGRASRYTRSRLPVTLVWSREVDSWGDALREEIRIKALSRTAKETLLRQEDR